MVNASHCWLEPGIHKSIFFNKKNCNWTVFVRRAAQPSHKIPKMAFSIHLPAGCSWLRSPPPPVWGQQKGERDCGTLTNLQYLIVQTERWMLERKQKAASCFDWLHIKMCFVPWMAFKTWQKFFCHHLRQEFGFLPLWMLYICLQGDEHTVKRGN